jgi:hypothetical protein
MTDEGSLNFGLVGIVSSCLAVVVTFAEWLAASATDANIDSDGKDPSRSQRGSGA